MLRQRNINNKSCAYCYNGMSAHSFRPILMYLYFYTPHSSGLYFCLFKSHGKICPQPLLPHCKINKESGSIAAGNKNHFKWHALFLEPAVFLSDWKADDFMRPFYLLPQTKTPPPRALCFVLLCRLISWPAIGAYKNSR